ncbi:hypothetical protein [Sphingomonas sp. LT1P40]|uniref:hypothetical protein n=1 Tax=Alteristakelama amylovorans TaxID=3096166 RepID=UPI002FC842F0
MRTTWRRVVETRLILAYGLLAILAVGGAVFARMMWYRSRGQRMARDRKRDQARAETRREQYKRDQAES